MKYVTKYLVIPLSFFSLFHCYAQNEKNWEEWDVIPGEVIITFKQNEGDSKITNFRSQSSNLRLAPIESKVSKQFKGQSRIKKEFKTLLPKTFIGYFQPNDKVQIIQKLKNDNSVEFFEPNRKRIASKNWGISQPNDPMHPLWGMERIGAPEAWALQPIQAAPVLVAICEDQFQTNHPDLIRQYSGLTNNDPSTGISDHATHVAGTVAATGNNGVGVAGVANVQLASMTSGESISDFINSISWAINNDIRIVNMSWKWIGSSCVDGTSCCDYPSPSRSVQTAIANAYINHDIIFVAAASNDTCTSDADGDFPIPVSYNYVIGVSNLNRIDQLNPSSNSGPYVTFTAPGTDINSTRLNGFGFKDGTSMAAPHVTGALAAILAVRPNFDAGSTIRLIALTVEDIGPKGIDPMFGGGVVRVDRAINGLADIYAETGGIHPEHGTLAAPYYSLNKALKNASENQSIGLIRGSYKEKMTISKSCTIIAVGGTVQIGN